MKTKLLLVVLVVCALVTVFFLGRATSPTTPSRTEVTRHPGVSSPVERAEREPARPRTRERPAELRRDTEPEEREKKAEPRAGPLPAAGRVTGRVSLEGGQSPEGAKVILKAVPVGENATPFERAAALDPSGEISVDDLPPGRYSIEASHPGYAPRKFAFDLTAGEGAGPFFFTLTKGGALVVRVKGGGGEPLPGEFIVVRADTGADRTAHEGLTDAEGEVRFERLPPGQHEIRRIIEEGSRTGPMRTKTVVPGQTVEVVFEVSCGLTGTVTGPDGNPLVDAFVKLTPAAFGREGYRNVKTRTDGEGFFEMQGFSPGEYVLSVQVVGKVSYTVNVGKVELASGQVLDRPVRIAPSSLSGRITRAATGEPLGHSEVQITAKPVIVSRGKIVKTLGGSVMAFADQEGRYSFVGLQPAHYQIWIASRVPELKNIWHIVDFSAGGDLENVDFALTVRALGTLRLRVLEPDGTPATGLSFGQRSGRNSGRSLHGKEVGDGIFEFQLEVGAREVYVTRGGFVADPVNVTIKTGATEEREVQLRVR
ncbi:MAG: carboxypeptidase regulatory-like domain-containing protein [Planctomycetota bacterium]|jgi:hypothetical protein